MTEQFPASSLRNCRPILEVLSRELQADAHILEIGSGSGYHALTFARLMTGWTWHPSEIADSLAQLQENLADSQCDNLATARTIDALTVNSLDAIPPVDAVYTCNTLHIMPQAAVEKLCLGVRRMLKSGGRFLCYGPFRRNGTATTPSNARFDDWLREQGGGMGLRDLEEIDRLTNNAGLRRSRLYAMPANNYFGVWELAAA